MNSADLGYVSMRNEAAVKFVGLFGICCMLYDGKDRGYTRKDKIECTYKVM
jgi:hypothetical protein